MDTWGNDMTIEQIRADAARFQVKRNCHYAEQYASHEPLIECMFAVGIASLIDNDLTGAKQSFDRVVNADIDSVATAMAREYLKEIRLYESKKQAR